MNLFWILWLAFFIPPSKETANRLREVFHWKQIDFQFENETHRQSMIDSGQFKPGNSIPTSLTLWTDKLFLTLPRFKLGVPATLAYIQLNQSEIETNVTSPTLIAYPNWESHDITVRNITSVLNIHADPCDRLWVLDSGQIENKHEKDPTLVTFDLKTNLQIDSQKVKSKTDYKTEPYLADIIVDVTSASCDSAYAYIADASNHELIVYSLRGREFHRITHNYFSFDPLGGDLHVDGVHYQTQFGIFSLALSPTGRDDHRTLFFSSLASTNQFAVSTHVIQNKSLDTIHSFYEFKVMGSRGMNAQSGASTFDEETGVLFYTLIMKHGIACWNSYGADEYTEKAQGIIVDDENIIYPSDVEVDTSGLLWALSNRLPKFQHGGLLLDDVNIRILTGSIRNIIKGTVCDAM